MRILMIGDVVGQLGRQTLQTYTPQLKSTYQPDVIVVNAENSANNGRGVTREIVREFQSLGIHCLTLGNHTWGQSEVFDFIDEEENLIRPANYPDGTPGKGFTTISTPKGKVTIMNLMGRSFMSPLTLDCPMRSFEKMFKQVSAQHYILVDFHAETTSEKQSFAWFVDGKASAVIGTHTHVQTADERILPKGTAYLTDVGMVGPYDGIIGMEREAVIRRYFTQLPVRFEVARGRTQLNAVLLDFDSSTKKARRIQRIRIDEDSPWFR